MKFLTLLLALVSFSSMGQQEIKVHDKVFLNAIDLFVDSLDKARINEVGVIKVAITEFMIERVNEVVEVPNRGLFNNDKRILRYKLTITLERNHTIFSSDIMSFMFYHRFRNVFIAFNIEQLFELPQVDRDRHIKNGRKMLPGDIKGSSTLAAMIVSISGNQIEASTLIH